MEEVIDILWNIEVIIGIETERSFEDSHFFNSEGSSVYVGGASFGGPKANNGADIEERGLVA